MDGGSVGALRPAVRDWPADRAGYYLLDLLGPVHPVTPRHRQRSGLPEAIRDLLNRVDYVSSGRA